MAKSKYPGFQILYEVGTRSELAQSYGVSERTMYRWLNKAKAETAPKRQSYPGAKAIQQFRGTRKELAQNFGISERTAYRWLNKARAEGANIPSRQMPSRYPGMDILEQEGSNVALGRKYGVSEATIRRWKKQAAAGLPEEIYTPDQLPQEIYTPEQLPEEIITPDMLPEEIVIPEEEQLPEMPEEIITEEPDNELVNASELAETLKEFDKISPDSEFLKLDKQQQSEYVYSYIKYQSQHNPELYYSVEVIGMTDLNPESVATLNIWGDTFETWLSEQMALDAYNPDWLDNL